MSNIIGLIGLGAMGGSYATHLLKNGYEVNGLDPNNKSSNDFTLKGGKILFNIKQDPNTLDSVSLNFGSDVSNTESSGNSGGGY